MPEPVKSGCWPSGEKTLSDKISEDLRFDSLAGQMVRVADVAANAGDGLGIYENLHDFASGRELSDYLSQQSVKFYGTPLRAFLQQLVAAPDVFRKTVSDRIDRFREQYCPIDASGQVQRVCARFGLSAVGCRLSAVGCRLSAAAGEIASELGILPWPGQTSEKAMSQLFSDWIAWRGGIGNVEEDKALEEFVNI